MAKKNKAVRQPLFTVPTLQDEEWQGMPEYSQKDQTSYQHIVVHFKCKEDVQKFAKLIDRKISSKTNSIWYPPISFLIAEDKRYADE